MKGYEVRGILGAHEVCEVCAFCVQDVFDAAGAMEIETSFFMPKPVFRGGTHVS